MKTKLTVTNQLKYKDFILVFGRKEKLLDDALPARFGVTPETWYAMVNQLQPSHREAVTSTWVGSRRIIVAALPSICSRHNSPSRAWAIPGLASRARNTNKAGIVPVVAPEHLEATVVAIAKGISAFSKKSKVVQKEIFVEVPDEVEKYQILANATRYAAQLFDRPTNDLNVSAFVAEAQHVAQQGDCRIQVIRGQELLDQGFGGIVGVGKAATDGPAFVTIYWEPENPTGSIAWVGKGIVYDTGGLSIKSKTGMPSMKGDMGGAAAVLAAFHAAVQLSVPYAVTAVLCLAENAVGPDATRPDDILVMKSGKTVEINNTDAEGRLVLADGVSWVANNTNCDTIVDIATLTGAAPMSVGKNMAAIYTNRDDLEAKAVLAGREIGEPCHPLPYTPELYFDEFFSHVADMKNSVKNRGNAQSACAGQFVGNHLPNSNHNWLHIDIAGPAWTAEKNGSGFGAGLLLKIAQRYYSTSEP